MFFTALSYFPCQFVIPRGLSEKEDLEVKHGRLPVANNLLNEAEKPNAMKNDDCSTIFSYVMLYPQSIIPLKHYLRSRVKSLTKDTTCQINNLMLFD